MNVIENFIWEDWVNYQILKIIKLKGYKTENCAWDSDFFKLGNEIRVDKIIELMNRAYLLWFIILTISILGFAVILLLLVHLNTRALNFDKLKCKIGNFEDQVWTEILE